MSQSISDFIGVTQERFDATGAFDAVLDIDSRFYIDPQLLKRTAAPELVDSYGKVQERFSRILRILALSKYQEDSLWREAVRLFNFGELRGLCIGYSYAGTSGSGMGPKFRAKILKTAKEIVDAGADDPAIFELVGILEEGVGSDRISDMLARIIREDLVRYSERVFHELEVPKSLYAAQGKTHGLPVNPYNNLPILLLPCDVLRPLPVANSWDEIDNVCDHNRELRLRLNAIIAASRGSRKGKPSTRAKKEAIRNAFVSGASVVNDIVKSYAAIPPPVYDFEKDPTGEIAWYRETRRSTLENPLPLSLPSAPQTDDVHTAVVQICKRFKELIENNGLNSLLYESNWSPKHESAAQKLFYGIADSYCKANDLDLNAEMNSGRGFIDFKVSRGYSARTVVEVKLTTNSSLKHGYEVQLQEYQKAEQTSSAVFLMIHVIGGSAKQANDIIGLVEKGKESGANMPELVYVDARRKTSASKYRALPNNSDENTSV